MEVLVASTQEDLKKCLKVRHMVFTVERNVPEEIERDGYDCLGGMCDHFLMSVEGEDIGALRCMQTDPNVVKIQRFCVLREYRRKGYARKLLDYVERYYHDAHITQLVLDAKFEVSVFYEKCGYVKVSDVFEEAGIPHVKMIKAI